MGQCVKKIYFHPENEPVDDDYDPGLHEGKIHILICGIDYSCDKKSWAGEHPLDTKVAFDFMIHLAQECKVDTIHTLWNEQCTRAGMEHGIATVGKQCADGDFFVFYYTGHGDRLKDDDGDEDSGFDSAMCLLGPDGSTEPRYQVWMRDDEFVEAIHGAVDPSVKVLVLCDCCHSGTLLDLSKPEWHDRGYMACSISGCTDKETSAGTGKGGMFSRAITTAVQALQERGESGYSVGCLYNQVLEDYQEHKSAGHTQHIVIHGVGHYSNGMAWPFQPVHQYVSPANTTLRFG